MMGDRCQKQCEEFYKSASYEKAVKNLEQDCNYASGGNIPKEIVDLMEKCCGNGEKLQDIVKDHSIMAKSSHYTPVPFASCKSYDNRLRRLVPVRDFIKYHLQTGDGSSSARTSDAIKLKLQEIRDDISKNGFEAQWDDALEGWTRRSGTVSWWTFNIFGTPIAITGKNYAEELATKWTGETQEFLDEDKLIVEIILTAEQLGVPLYKPTALERFEENTLFRPYPADKNIFYGMTCPASSGKCGRPELISESVCYKGKGVITTQYWDY